MKDSQISWLLVFAFIVHLLEEYFGGEGFVMWFSNFFNTNLSPLNFIIINSVALMIVLTIAINNHFRRPNYLAIIAVGVLFFINGWAHLLASIYTWSYFPGLISGIIIYLPLGVLIYKKIYIKSKLKDRQWGVLIGVGFQILVNVIAQAI